MNNSVNYAMFLNLVTETDDEFEPYGMSSVDEAVAENPYAADYLETPSSRLTDRKYRYKESV